MRKTVTPLLLFTLFATVAAAAPAKPAARPDARAALERVVARMRALQGYRIEGEATLSMSGPQGEQSNVTSLRFLSRRPHELVMELASGTQSQRVIANHDTMWTVMPVAGEYQAQAMSTFLARTDSAQVAGQLDPLSSFHRMLDEAVTVESLGPDTVRMASGVVTCQRYAISPGATGLKPEVTAGARVVWVDPRMQMVVMDSLTLEQRHPTAGTYRNTSRNRFTVVVADPTLSADTFVFHPGPDMRRVKTFLPRSQRHAGLEGETAPDFSLEELGGEREVKLSELKGKVVVLDFWATWCGPCRRWLPIVAKVHRELAAKGVEVFAVNLREDEAKVRQYLQAQKLGDVPVLMDYSARAGGLFRADSIPTTAVIGRDGRVSRVLVGLHTEEDLLAAIEEAGL